jgi:hypothetical protein
VASFIHLQTAFKMADAKKTRVSKTTIAIIIGIVTSATILLVLFKDKVKAAVAPLLPAPATLPGSSMPAPSTTAPITPAAVSGKPGDIVTIAPGHTSVNVRNAPTAANSANIVGKYSSGAVLGTFDSTVVADGYTWVKFLPYGPVTSGIYWYVASQYVKMSPAAADDLSFNPLSIFENWQ